MDEKLVGLSFSIDPLCVSNYKEIKLEEVMSRIWHQMTQNKVLAMACESVTKEEIPRSVG